MSDRTIGQQASHTVNAALPLLPVLLVIAVCGVLLQPFTSVAQDDAERAVDWPLELDADVAKVVIYQLQPLPVVTAPVDGGHPAPRAACRAGAWPTPAVKAQPM